RFFIAILIFFPFFLFFNSSAPSEIYTLSLHDALPICDDDAVKRSLDDLRRVAETGENIMPATIALAHAGGTTGEWAGVLREVFRSEEHTSELQSRENLVCRLLLEKKKEKRVQGV